MAKSKAPTTPPAKTGRLSKFKKLIQSLVPHDKRTARSSKRIERDLSDHYKPKEIAKQLGVSTQKWVSTRRKIREGKLYAPELRDSLKKVNSKLERIEVKQLEKKAKQTPRRLDDGDGAFYWPDHAAMKKKIKHARVLKTADTLTQVKKWHEGITGGQDYFIITKGKSNKTGREVFHVVDIRNQKELNAKRAGKPLPDGQARATQILMQFGDRD